MTITQLHEIFLSCGSVVSTDSRTLQGGELFFALKGENFDGNLYVNKALEAGASYAVTEDPTKADNAQCIVVEDSLETLRELARFHRLHATKKPITVIGLTGTNGKTTTKELLNAVLSKGHNVIATQGNLNNDIGVPLSLLKIKDDTEIAIIEMGASHPNDINHLTEVSMPDFGLITNVGKAHLAGFGSFEGVCQTKGELYDYLAANNGAAFLNIDDEKLVSMVAERPGLKSIPYGSQISGIKVEREKRNAECAAYLSFSCQGKIYETHLTGDYNLVNISAAIGVGTYFGISTQDACEAIASYVPSNSRSQIIRTENNIIIADAYNANPTSMVAALTNIKNLSAEKKAVFLGDMRELGEDSVHEHMNILRQAEKSSITRIFLVGEEFQKALINIGKRPAVTWFADVDALADYLSCNKLQGGTVLIKGSNSMHMGKIIKYL